MAKKGAKLKGVAAVSIVTVGIAMGAGPIRGVGPGVASAANPNDCGDFAANFFKNTTGGKHIAEGKLEARDGGVTTGSQQTGLNVGGFYQVASGAAEVFMKDDVVGGVQGVSVCVDDTKDLLPGGGFFEGETLLGAKVSLDEVNSTDGGLLKVTLADGNIITTTFKVSVGDIPITVKVDKSTPILAK